MSMTQEEVQVRMGVDLSKLERGLAEGDRIFQQYSRKRGSAMYQGGGPGDGFTPQSWSTMANLAKRNQQDGGGGGGIFGGVGMLLLNQLRGATPLVNNFTGALGGMAGKLAGIGLAASAAVAGFLGLKNAIRGAWEMAEKGEALGVSSRFVLTLERAAYASGDSLDQLTSKLGRLKNVVGEAADGNKQAIGTLEELGIVPWGKTMEENYLAIGEALSKIEDPAKRARLQTELFGKGAEGVTDMLSKLSEQSRKARLSLVEQKDLDVLAAVWQKIRDIKQAAVDSGKDWLTLSLASTFRFFGMKDGEGKEPGTISKPSEAKTPEQIKEQQEKLNKARKEYQDALEKSYNSAARELNLRFKAKDLEKEVAGLAGESVKKYEKLKELAEARNEITKLQKQQQDEYNRSLEKQKQYQEEYNNLTKQARSSLTDAGNAYNDRSKWSLEAINQADRGKQLMAISQYLGRPLMPGEMMALNQGMMRQQILGGKAQLAGDAAKAFSLAGMGEMAAQATESELGWRKRIDGLSSSERDPLAANIEKLQTIDENISSLLKKAGNEGIRIVPRMGE